MVSITRVASLKVDTHNFPHRFTDIVDFLVGVFEYSSKEEIFSLEQRIKNKIHQFIKDDKPTGSFTRTGTWMVFLSEDEFTLLSSAKMLEGVTFSEWRNSIRDPRDDENGDLYIPIPKDDDARRKGALSRAGISLRNLKAMGLISKYEQRSNSVGSVTHIKIMFDRSVPLEQKKMVYLYLSSTYLSSPRTFTSKEGKEVTYDSIDCMLGCRWWHTHQKR